MSVVRCPRGHFYDDQRFSQCPHCGIAAGSSGKESGLEPKKKRPDAVGTGMDGKTQGLTGEKKRGLFGWLDREKSSAFPSDKAVEMEEEKTVAFASDRREDSGEDHTVALKNISEDDQDDQRTIGFFSGAKGNDFVTGWLVCVEGREKGRDYRLHHGFNRIGRSFSMDVQIMEDLEIVEETHCSIVYDDKSNQFSLLPSHGAITYYQGQLLGGPETLHTGDEIRMGNSCFVFIPFCGEGRVWEKEEK